MDRDRALPFLLAKQMLRRLFAAGRGRYRRRGQSYGTTSGGGRHNFGSLFELMPDNNESKWTQTTLYNFCSETKCSDGNYPWTPPLIDNESNLYGTTAGGGTRRIPGGGVVYTLTP